VHYLDLLRRLHEELRPAGYLEIGVDRGDSLRLSRARSVAIDPAPKPHPKSLLGKQGLILYVGASDDFFRAYGREAILGDTPLDLAFIDGLHRFAQVVRDLEHVERWSHVATVVAIHDVLPRNVREAAPACPGGAWTGDVWRIVPFLREHRSDLRCWLTDATPTGMLIVTGLDPSHRGMADLAAALDADFPTAGPEYDRLVDAFLTGAAPEPADHVLLALRQSRQPVQKQPHITM
jgi:predicted O-methyltransferase YrrM